MDITYLDHNGIVLATFIFAAAMKAYLDPGSGSFIIQLIVGGIVGLIVVLKVYWNKIRSVFPRSNEINDSGAQNSEIID